MPGLLYHSYRQLNEFDRSLRALRNAGFGPLTEPYQIIYRLKATALEKLGFKIPKPMSLLKLVAGLSPGSVKVFHDAESGFFVDARAYEGAPPIYHHVTDEVAGIILGGGLTHELEAELMKPDEYLGE